MSGLAPLPGHPGAVRLLADRLLSTAQRLSTLAGVLSRLRAGATWDGPAGDAFGARLHEVVPVLDAVSVRLGGAVAPLRALADAMEREQVVVEGAVRDVADGEHAYAALEQRVEGVMAAGAGEASPEVLVLRHLQEEQVALQQQARARHAAAAERFREVDGQVAAALRTLSVDGLADSLPYRVLAGVSTAGHDLASLGPVATVVPELRPVAAVADAAAVGADVALLVAYGEGDAGRLALAAGLTATGAVGGVLRAGATAGARRTATGAVSTARLTARERLAIGLVREARARRDALRATTRVPPSRGTPSALLGGPAPRSGVWGAGRTGGGRAGAAGAAATARVATAAREAASRGAALARRRADRAFLDDWRLATANGAQAQRMYTAGATLEVAAAGAARSGAGRPEGGGGPR